MPTETMQKKQFLVANFSVKAKDETARTFEGYLNTWELDLATRCGPARSRSGSASSKQIKTHTCHSSTLRGCSGGLAFRPACPGYLYTVQNSQGFLYMTFREITDALAVPLETVAEVIGRSYATVLSYRTGDREPPPEVFAALATFIRSHAKHLGKLADELERE
jgi:hypothetical protein